MIDSKDLIIKTLGPCRIDSPMAALARRARADVSQRRRVGPGAVRRHGLGPRRAGLPIEELPGVRAGRAAARRSSSTPRRPGPAIVTCGGLCPGLNDVIRALVLELHFHYGVRKIYGFCNGYQGFIAKYKRDVLDLTPEFVSGHQRARRHDPRHLARRAGPARRSSIAWSG